MTNNINKFLLTTALTIGSLSLAVADASKSTSAGSFYGKVEAGGAVSTKLSSQSFKFTKSKADTGPALGLETGYKFDNNLRLGLNLGYQQNDVSSYTKGAVGKESGENYIPELNFKMGKLKLGTAMFNVYYDIENSTKFTPYFTVGFGASRNKIDKSSVKYIKEVPAPNPDPFNIGPTSVQETVGYKSNSKNNFTWNIGLGGLYQINQSISLDVGYKYKDLGKISTSLANPELDGEMAGLLKLSKKYTARVKSHNITFGVIYNF